MNIIRKAFRQMVDQNTMDPAWIQGEVNRLTGNKPDVCDVILKGRKCGLTEYPENVALRNW